MSKNVFDKSVEESKIGATTLAKPVLSPLLGFTVDRTGLEEAANEINSMKGSILGVWLLSRPVMGGISDGKFTHWSVKILTGKDLLELDFGEQDGHGVFGRLTTTTSPENLRLCFQYPGRGDEPSEYEIIASIVPMFTDKGCEVIQKLSAFTVGKNVKEYIKNTPRQIPYFIGLQLEHAYPDDSDLDQYAQELMSCVKSLIPGKIISDVGVFLNQWGAKHKKYDALYCNCQKFAYDLFSFLMPSDNKKIKQKIVQRFEFWFSFFDFFFFLFLTEKEQTMLGFLNGDDFGDVDEESNLDHDESEEEEEEIDTYQPKRPTKKESHSQKYKEADEQKSDKKSNGKQKNQSQSKKKEFNKT
ncbi:hypothetical protein RFI_27754 [Reticulomyxa filosa]|uniref:Uncharacterized protein n=1 Tax=Reticulomyxa filosa TaxID=46433 RepID=X6M9D1_RETFI|nr:hypothetical protein RFI_27754 [Reticulomyxa filosa]|eukprot:ETO09625.1 hypothetical protein RFI_27754 [Reticulomyxa filosa]